MSKLLVVFGATGNQGGSVVQTVISDPALSSEYKVRAITRNASKVEAQALQKTGKVEVVEADADNKQTLKRALDGAHTVFAVTVTIYDERLEERELSQGKAIADAAVAAGAQYFIFSTVFHIARVSGGKYNKARHFDSRAEVEDYVRGLPIKSAFFAPSSFMQNFNTIMKPHPVGDGTYALTNIVASHTQMPLVVIEETGKYVGAILANPDAFEGKIIAGASQLLSMEEIVEIMSKSSGKTVVYKQLPEDVFRGFLPRNSADYLIHMMLYIQDFGYYGAQSRELVSWSVANARGSLTSLESYLAEHPLNLE